MKKAMMKKLIFCLLVLTGAGMLNSCQQDEIVNEAPASKGVTIRASLPNDAQSRVTLGDTEGNKTKVCWEEGDKITLTITSVGYEPQTHTFTISEDYSNSNLSNSADFTCDDDIAIDPSKTYTFTYGTANSTQEVLFPASELENNYPMEYVYRPTANDTWNNVNLVFSVKVVLVEISCNDITINSNTKVSMYDAKTGALLASGQGKSNEKMYFKVAPKSYEAIFIVENNGNVYGKKVDNKTLSVNNLYKVELTSGNQMTNIGSSTVKYFTHTKDNKTTYCIYGNGYTTIPGNAFYGTANEGINSLIILNGITTIGSDAFYHGQLERVIIPATVSKIETNAFYNCKSGCNFYVMPTTPPALESNVFGMNPENNNYYVPSGSVNTYKGAEGWSNYEEKIQAIP